MSPLSRSEIEALDPLPAPVHQFRLDIHDKLRRTAQVSCACGYVVSFQLDNGLVLPDEVLAIVNRHLMPRISWRAA